MLSLRNLNQFKSHSVLLFFLLSFSIIFFLSLSLPCPSSSHILFPSWIFPYLQLPPIRSLPHAFPIPLFHPPFPAISPSNSPSPHSVFAPPFPHLSLPFSPLPPHHLSHSPFLSLLPCFPFLPPHFHILPRSFPLLPILSFLTHSPPPLPTHSHFPSLTQCFLSRSPRQWLPFREWFYI